MMNSEISTLRHIIMKLSKIKDKKRVLEMSSEKRLVYKWAPIRLSVDFSEETYTGRNNIEEMDTFVETYILSGLNHE